MKKIIILITIFLMLTGCRTGKNEVENGGNNLQGGQNTAVNIGGVHLGDSKDTAVKILGSDYKEMEETEGGYFGEAYYTWDYTKGISLIIGKASGKVLQIDALSPDYPTELGIKVGDRFDTVSGKYDPLYKNPQSKQGEGALVGWYELKEDQIVIFDFNKDDDSLVNKEVKPDSTVQRIRLTYSKFID